MHFLHKFRRMSTEYLFKNEFQRACVSNVISLVLHVKIVFITSFLLTEASKQIIIVLSAISYIKKQI